MSWLKDRIRELTITKRLRLASGAVLTTNSGTASESDVSLTELAVLDGVTAGTVTASKGVVVDSNKDIGDFRNLDAVNFDAGASGTAGSYDVFPATASKGKLTISCADQDGNTTVTLKALGMAQASEIDVPDPGAATAYAVLSSQANDQSLVTATNAEINAACDVSARIVNTTATTLAVTAATHSGKVVTVNSAAPIAITLPASTGGGDEYKFVIGTLATATAHTIKVANTTDVMAGVSVIAQTDTAQVNGFLTTATDDTISLNGTTKGGLKGDEVFIRDIAAGVFQVRIVSGASGTVVTPFSASV